MMSMREQILVALQALLATDPFFPPAAIDEPEPSRWVPATADGIELLHSVAVQDGPPPDVLAFVRGGEDEFTDEIELEAAIAYGVQAKPGPGDATSQLRTARRASRDLAVRKIAALIAQDRTLGLGAEVYAQVGAPARDDDVSFANTLPAATAVVPVRVLYTATDAAA